MIKKIVIGIVIILVGIQFISVDKTNPPLDEKLTLKAPAQVMEVMKQSCFDCHSNETKWPYYADIAPMSFVVADHVKDARRALNFSKWNEISEEIKILRLKRAIVTVKNGMMALPSYVSAHEEAELSKEDKTILITWFESELKTLTGDNKNHLFQVK
ncbi:MAG: hypothetical protein ACI9TV_003050 [Sulfurimonas sp.]|jgi:hypothetical protein|uniref:heme-binding domain-containing protein n=1 Tax=Sulfurimonas sp. TaxID=2022749 RepID=UPI0039E4917A